MTCARYTFCIARRPPREHPSRRPAARRRSICTVALTDALTRHYDAPRPFRSCHRVQAPRTKRAADAHGGAARGASGTSAMTKRSAVLRVDAFFQAHGARAGPLHCCSPIVPAGPRTPAGYVCAGAYNRFLKGWIIAEDRNTANTKLALRTCGARPREPSRRRDHARNSISPGAIPRPLMHSHRAAPEQCCGTRCLELMKILGQPCSSHFCSERNKVRYDGGTHCRVKPDRGSPSTRRSRECTDFNPLTTSERYSLTGAELRSYCKAIVVVS